MNKIILLVLVVANTFAISHGYPSPKDLKENEEQQLSFVTEEPQENEEQQLSFVTEEPQENEEQQLSFVTEEPQENEEQQLSFVTGEPSKTEDNVESLTDDDGNGQNKTGVQKRIHFTYNAFSYVPNNCVQFSIFRSRPERPCDVRYDRFYR